MMVMRLKMENLMWNHFIRMAQHSTLPRRLDRGFQSSRSRRNQIVTGQLGKLKVEQCEIYLRKYELRLTGTKDTLIQRIKEHLDVLDGGGEKKYPVSSFVLNCKADACTDDIVMFEQNVYDM